MQKCCHAEPARLASRAKRVEVDNCIILNTLYELQMTTNLRIIDIGLRITKDYELQMATNLRIIDIGHEIKKRTLFKMR